MAQAAKIVLLCVAVFVTLSIALVLSQARFLTVTGTSMEPAITQNDIVLVLPVNSDEIKAGKVIVYRHEVDGKTYQFVHRVVEVNGKSLLTKGDSLSTVDNYVVRSDDVVGVVVFKIPYAGWFVRFMNTVWGYVLFILMPGTALIIFEIRQIWREIKCKN
ncbi:signal peptidase I [Archaeoglobus veneficus]|uniref:Peptidase S26B, signal peptidase n=1 Tax=Archaeoglobus veneficus (strain DSM 11195 / SNP6) TaxID=693661 RepID=F2KN31_ARCVS|nr:signal peptidase I [Archaeoglobus veneficus]AEA47307.1 peptidase S26B, signal peptidase [Archaeoglobus veneficus SNP6]